MNKLKLKSKDQNVTVNLIWLRDNCKCELCYDWNTFQRKRDDLIVDVKIKQYTVENNTVFITWQDDHVSNYDFDWLVSQVEPEKWPRAILWTPEIIQRHIPFIECQKDLLTEKAQVDLVKSLCEYGVAVVKNVTPTIEATETVATHIGPVMKTLFGQMWEIKLEDISKYKDTAYSTQLLTSHTDNTYFIEPAGIIVFHCLKPADRGGVTVLLDGFKAANLLKQHDVKFYDCLKSTPIEWQYISNDYNLKLVSNIFHTQAFSDDLEQIRFNMYDRSPRAPITNDMNLFYSSLHYFRNILNDKRWQWKIQLTPGNVLFINNWRIMHGRTAFAGKRVMVGCYQAMGTLLSKARTFKIIR